jgi:hypothetical protein
MPTLSDNYATVLLNFPDSPGEKVSFVLLETFVSGTGVFDSGETYRIALDDEGRATVRLPVPDETGELAARYRVVMPNGKRHEVWLAWHEDDYEFSELVLLDLQNTSIIQPLGTIPPVPSTLVRRDESAGFRGWYLMQPMKIESGRTVTVPGGMNILSWGDFPIEPGGELVLEPGGTHTSIWQE